MADRHSTDKLPVWKHKASGLWAKKAKGRIYYLSKDLDEALAIFEANKETILAGRQIVSADGYTIGDIVNKFLAFKREKVQSGELSPRTYEDYKKTGAALIEFYGRTTAAESLTPSDFMGYKSEVGKRRNLIGVGNEVTRAKTIFKWSFEMELIAAPRFGPDFGRPTNKAVRRHRREKGKKLLTAEQILLLLDEVGLHLRAMVLLGINGGFGNSECAKLPLNVIDLENGIIDWYRPKTEVDRLVTLWPETIEALRASLKRRPEPTEESAEDKFFVTQDGLCFARDEQTTNKISQRTTYAFQRLKIHQPSMSFYWLRHTHRTIADQVKDQPAADLIMGHVTQGISATYRQEIGIDRVRAITDHVRQWLYGGEV